MFSEKLHAPRRHFQMTVGLMEGYGTHVSHSADEVENLVDEWMRTRMEADVSVLTGFVISPKQRMVYGWKSPATGIKTNREDVVLLSGIVNPLYSANLSDESVVTLLKDLANFIGGRLNQTRMYIEYMDTVVITQSDQATHPTEKK